MLVEDHRKGARQHYGYWSTAEICPDVIAGESVSFSLMIENDLFYCEFLKRENSNKSLG